MKLRKRLQKAQAPQPRIARLLLLCTFFAIGIICGQLIPCEVVSGELADFVRSLASLTVQGGAAKGSFPGIVAAYLRWPVILFLLSFCAFGTIMIPLVCAWQGFTLSFAITCLAGSMGKESVLLALAAFGVRSVILLPCTLLIAQYAIDRALCRLRRQSSGEIPALRWRWMAVCLALLLVGIVLETTVVPRLFSLALSRIQI